MLRVGHGYDIHRFKKTGKLILAGIEIPYEKGIDAHSDGDVVIHALCDALLGAAALGDIGQHFPDNDSRYAGIDSRLLLKEVVLLLNARGFFINNVDVTVITQAPKLAPYILKMRETLALDMQIEISQVSVKAKTNEKLDAIGAEEGIVAHAVVSVESVYIPE